MDRLSTLLPKTLRKHGLKDEADASLVVHKANEWLREKGMTDGITVKQLKSTTLIIEAKSSIAAQECHAQSEELLAEMQTRFSPSAIQKVHILRERNPVAG